MSDCPFCYLDSERTRIVQRRDYVYVLLSNPRLVEGHLLVVPTRHVEKFSQLNQKERLELWNTIVEYQERILERFASGCDIRQNYRPFQKQNRLKVNHLHVHLQPRELEDELYQKCQIHEKEIYRELTKFEMECNKGLFTNAMYTDF